MIPARVLRCRRGADYPLPLFLPVYQPGKAFMPLGEERKAYAIEGCIVNAFFLYKDRATRAAFEQGRTLREHVNQDGVLMTDSGAFQGFTRTLYLSNKVIVKFQDSIGTDISSPLDLVTPPGDKRGVAEHKSRITVERIREAREVVQRSLLAGVQQGGRFLDLRRHCLDEILKIGIEYLAIGSLVPFFNQNHDLKFVGAVLRDARQMIGPAMPMHIYGAGDPVELPFFVAMGADIFDSSSYGHYARQGCYMTPFGALKERGPVEAGEYVCACPICSRHARRADVWNDETELIQHNLWTIGDVVRRVRLAVRDGTLEAMLVEILERHRRWFPASRLGASWEEFHAGR